jgi:hypothetical protein
MPFLSENLLDMRYPILGAGRKIAVFTDIYFTGVAIALKKARSHSNLMTQKYSE